MIFHHEQSNVQCCTFDHVIKSQQYWHVCIINVYIHDLTIYLMMLLCIIIFAMCHYVQEILEGSTDTSITTIEWALAELLKHPKFMKKAQDELDDVIGQDRVVDESDIPQLKYLQAIVKETFRLHPPAPLMVPHQNMEACEIGGYHILPKTQIFVNLWAIHRHSSTYENPLEFNPDRFLQTNVDLKGKHFELLPFGSGRRICPGVLLGLLIVQMQLARLLHSFTWKLPKGENPQDMDMGEVFGITTRKAIPLRAIAIARLPQHLYLAPQFT